MDSAGDILVVNAGSSSIKFALYAYDLTLRFKGEADTCEGGAIITIRGPDGRQSAGTQRLASGRATPHGIVEDLMQWLRAELGDRLLWAVGHRVALGGLEHTGPVLVTAERLAALRSLVPLAPLHQPRNLAPIDAVSRLYPSLPQVACFDTAFHRTLPRVAEIYGLPRHLTDAGARRYGFHGLSYEHIAGRLASLSPRAAQGRTVVAHLGSGASLCALQAGRSIATTMGFSALSGLVMGTRPGELDAGLLIWLLRERGLSVSELEAMLYTQSGLMGVSGLSGDMRTLIGSVWPEAQEAVELFVYRACIELGGLAAALGGLDALVFTAGIGEHSAAVRSMICARSAWLGIEIDEAANNRHAERIIRRGSRVSAWVVGTDEELIVARHTKATLIKLASGTS